MSDLLEQMRRNPASDWTINDVERLCRQHGLRCDPPRGGGSHYKISKAGSATILTLPYRRPIKPIYIRKLVAFAEAPDDAT